MSQIEQLRQLLLGENAEQIAELKDRLESVERRTSDVAEVLSPAIESELRTGGQALIDSLNKPVSMGLKKAIRSEPAEYAEILYPVMAPSIRRAIAQAISSMLVTINKTLESATSVQGLSMRFESMRTGVPYAELALRSTLLYRVEHVYLIERATGMLIKGVHAPDTQSLDNDAVSAMFSAIQSFVQDSFSQDESARLTDLKVGEHNVWVAHGQRAMLACVILGDAPESIKASLYDHLDAIRVEYANAIAEFDGDDSRFEHVEDHMEPLLQIELKNSEKGKDAIKERSIGSMLVLAGLGLLLSYLVVQWAVGRSHVSTVEYFLRETPGIAPTAVYWRDGKLVVEGLKDPDAVVPYKTFESYDIKPDTLEFKMIPFRSLELGMELQRFEREFKLPSGVHLEEREGRIFLYGEAPLSWLLANDARIRQLAADHRLTIDALSASVKSVLNLLRADLPSAALSSEQVASGKGREHPVVNIGGRVNAAELARLQAMFAGNAWVAVTAEAL